MCGSIGSTLSMPPQKNRTSGNKGKFLPRTPPIEPMAMKDQTKTKIGFSLSDKIQMLPDAPASIDDNSFTMDHPRIFRSQKNRSPRHILHIHKVDTSRGESLH